MIVLGHRVLIRPDEQPEPSDSAVLLDGSTGLSAEEQRIWRGAAHKDIDREWIATSGTVVQVGQGGSLLAYKARQRALQAAESAVVAACSPLLENDGIAALAADVLQAIVSLKGTADPVSDVQVGDRVAFDADTGLAFSFDGEPLLILNQDDIVILVEEAEEAA